MAKVFCDIGTPRMVAAKQARVAGPSSFRQELPGVIGKPTLEELSKPMRDRGAL